MGTRPGPAIFLLLALAALAMGVQGEAVRNAGAAVSTTYLTGTLTTTISSLVRGPRSDPAVRINATILCSAVAGAAGGAGLIRLAPDTLPVLPLVALAGVVAGAGRGVRA